MALDDRPTVDPLDRLRLRRSAKWRNYPPDVLPLTVAEMDVNLAPAIQDVLHDAVARSDAGYPMPVPELGQALAGCAESRWGWRIDPTAVVAVPDVSVAVVQLLRVLTRLGDTVVINPPVYPPFFEWLPETDTQVLEVPLAHDPDSGWRLDLPALERAFATGPAVYLLCNPHNPVGRMHRPDELAAVVELATRYQVSVISDEIHGPLALPGATFTPLLTIPGAAEIAVSVHSTSKAWNLAGLKCASIVTGSPAMRAVTDRLPPDDRWRVGHFGVLASIAAYTEAPGWLDGLLAALDERRMQLAELIRTRLPVIDWQPPEATYLAWLDCTRLGTDPFELFLEKGRVAFEAGPKFGAPGVGHVRLNFGTSAEILTEAVTRMADAVTRCDSSAG